jgi:hypothetical protein
MTIMTLSMMADSSLGVSLRPPHLLVLDALTWMLAYGHQKPNADARTWGNTAGRYASIR